MSSNAAAASASSPLVIDQDISGASQLISLNRTLLPCSAIAPGTRARILYVASTRHSGGLEVASVRLATKLMQTYGDRLEIFFACRPGQFVEQECAQLGIPAIPLYVRNSGDWRGAQRLIDIVQSERIDIIHVHSRRDYVIAALAVAWMRRNSATGSVPKLLLHLHLVRALGSPAFLSGFVFAPLVDKVLAVSQSVRRHVLRYHPQLAPGQVVVVSNSVDTSKFRRDPAAGTSIRQQYGIPESAIVIGMVGRLDAKGQEQVIRALADPKLSGRKPYLLLIGNESMPGIERRLARRVKRLGLERQVVFCGAQSNVAPYLSAMDIFAHMPLDEAFGLAPAEAMASGLPVLASNIGGCAELINHDETGLFAHPLECSEIAAQLLRLIEDPALRDRLGAAGAREVLSNYSSAAQIDSLLAIYEELAISCES